MKSPHSFSAADLIDYHKNQLAFMRKNFRNKVLCGQMKDTTATKLIAMQEYTLQLVKEKDPARQMRLGENVQPKQ